MKFIFVLTQRFGEMRVIILKKHLSKK